MQLRCQLKSGLFVALLDQANEKKLLGKIFFYFLTEFIWKNIEDGGDRDLFEHFLKSEGVGGHLPVVALSRQQEVLDEGLRSAVVLRKLNRSGDLKRKFTAILISL